MELTLSVPPVATTFTIRSESSLPSVTGVGPQATHCTKGLCASTAKYSNQIKGPQKSIQDTYSFSSIGPFSDPILASCDRQLLTKGTFRRDGRSALEPNHRAPPIINHVLREKKIRISLQDAQRSINIALEGHPKV